ncbi:MAG TPA: preprotein translocase subunit SecG [Acholeplasma sp.]|jgi:preprotein translocase subunit SecG
MVFIDYVIFIVSIFIILISALQSSNEDVMDAFTGGNKELFKNRKIQGAELVLNWSMFGLGLALIVFVIISNNVDRFWNI